MLPRSSPYFSLVIFLVFSFNSLSRCQTVSCLPGDVGCERCKSTCGTIQPSHLPECCEAFNTCCDEYFAACKQCNSVRLTDKFFPEYCCASFTSCCDLVTTINVSPTTTRSPEREPLLEDYNHQQLTIQRQSQAPEINEVNPAPNSRTRGPNSQQSRRLESQGTEFSGIPQQPESVPLARGSNRRRENAPDSAQSGSHSSTIQSQRTQRRQSSRGRINTAE